MRLSGSRVWCVLSSLGCSKSVFFLASIEARFLETFPIQKTFFFLSFLVFFFFVFFLYFFCSFFFFFFHFWTLPFCYYYPFFCCCFVFFFWFFFFFFLHLFSNLSLFLLLAFLIILLFFDVFFKGSLHSGKSEVTRVTVGRDTNGDTNQPTKVFEFVTLILRPSRSQFNWIKLNQIKST